MSHILISGLVNTETTCRVRGFPIQYEPVDYNFFGVNTAVSGVGFNLAKAMTTLGNSVETVTLLGSDAAGELALAELEALEIGTKHVSRRLKATPASVVLYDSDGRRRIYCDLKDIQQSSCDFGNIDLSQYDAAVACNINFSRPLLHAAKTAGIPIVTDVHVLGDIDDEYNREFMENADILFLSDEKLPCEPREFLRRIEQRFGNEIIVLGQGGNGALMYVRSEQRFYSLTAAVTDKGIVNTVGAGDALLGSFVSLYAEGLHPLECLKRAQLFAAAKISENGAAKGFVTRGELEALFETFGGTMLEKD